MSNIASAKLHRLLEAAELLQAHGQDSFYKRSFMASNLLFPNCFHSFGLYRKTDNDYIGNVDFPFTGEGLKNYIYRLSELVPTQHPVMPLLRQGLSSPIRLSDTTTLRQFRRSDLYEDIFKPIGIKYEIVLPLYANNYVGGLTLTRGGKDFDIEDVAIAGIFSRHLMHSFETDQLLQRASSLKQELTKMDFLTLRRKGLSRRECEVLWWISQGKRDGEIAVILSISMRTVNHHTSHILEKLRVETRTGAAAFARAYFTNGDGGA